MAGTQGTLETQTIYKRADLLIGHVNTENRQGITQREEMRAELQNKSGNNKPQLRL